MEDPLNQDITPIPPVPNEIKEAVNEGRLAVFIGAGVSRLVGCDGWDKLAYSLLSTCYKTYKNGDRLINYKEKETLGQIQDHKKLITSCYHILKNSDCEDFFYQEMEKSLRCGKTIDAENIYKELIKLRGLFITTNADTHFDDFFIPSNVIFEVGNFKKDLVDKTNLYHIHGSITSRESLVFTVSEYMKRYNNPDFRFFLEKIFNEYTILFVGYGLGEFEILDFLLRDKKEKKHFILAPFFKGEDNILSFEQSYYGDLGVFVLPYEKDENGYVQLYEVIKHWNNEINLSTKYLPKTTKEIEDAVHSFSSSKINSTLQKIRNDEALERFFFKVLCKSQKALNWLTPLIECSYFLPENNPSPIEDSGKPGMFSIPFWGALEVLLHICKEINQSSESEKSKRFDEIGLIVDQIIEFQLGKDRIDNHRSDAEIINILSEMPIHYICDKHMEYINSCFKTTFQTTRLERNIGTKFLPHLIKNQEKNSTLNLLKVVFQPNQTKKRGEREITGIMEDYYLKEAISKNKDGILKLCAIEASKTVIEIMEGILSEDSTQFSITWIPTIEDHEQKTFPDRYECQLVDFARNMLEQSNPDCIKITVKELLESEHEIFRRLAFHLINYHYAELNQIFWELKESPLGKTYIHELYELLKNNSSSLSKEQMKNVLNWINAFEVRCTESENDEECRDKIRAYYKKEWLSALLESNNQTVKSLYKKYDEINDASLDHPGFHIYYSGVDWVKDVSPVEKDEFFAKSNQQKADFIKSYPDLSRDHFDTNHERKSLTYAIREFVAESPKNFTQDLDPFLDIQRKYQLEIIRGFEQAWKNENELEWGEIFDFITNIISSKGFWDTGNENEQSQIRWCISTISDLINEGTKSDSHAFLPEHLVDAETIIINLFSNYKEEDIRRDDPVSFILNSGIGRLLMASVNLSLRYARANTTGDKKRWLDSIRLIFDERLKQSSQAASTSIVITMYLANINFLDSEWLQKNFDSIFNKDDDSQWELAMVSFLSSNSTLYEFAYHELNQGGHYHKALNYDFDDSIRKNVVHNIGLGYFAEWDSQDLLISTLINKGSSDQLSDLIQFVWQQEKREKRFQDRIRVLWELIIKRIKANPKEFESPISDIISWISLFDLLDDKILTLLSEFSATHLSRSWASRYLYKDLNRLASSSPKNTAKLLLKITDEGNYCEYQNEEIRGVISALYEAGEIYISNRVCNLYLQKGYHFLRDIFDQFNPGMTQEMFVV